MTGNWGPLNQSLNISMAERDHLDREAAKRATMEIFKSVELEESDCEANTEHK